MIILNDDHFETARGNMNYDLFLFKMIKDNGNERKKQKR